MKDIYKISFLGDIMCEKPLQNYYSKVGDKAFDHIFDQLSPLLVEADYVVGNLETVFAGKQGGYTKHIYCFNTPDSFATAIKNAGFDMVTTATNHSLDRGVAGLIRTLDVLDQNGLEHIGTYRSREEQKRPFVKQLGSTSIAFLSYSYGTNTHETNIILDDAERFHLNLIKPQTYQLQENIGEEKSDNALRKMLRVGSRSVSLESKMKIKKMLRMQYNLPRTDSLTTEDRNCIFYEKVEKDIKRAKQCADLVVICSHMGGQFNAEPGDFSRQMANFFCRCGADLVVATHPHIVQNIIKIESALVAFCLGNVTISPSSVYLLHEYKPEYSVVLHMYVKNKKIDKETFSLLKIIEEKNGDLVVWPLDRLYDTLSPKEQTSLIGDAEFIFHRFLGDGRPFTGIMKEYLI